MTCALFRVTSDSPLDSVQDSKQREPGGLAVKPLASDHSLRTLLVVPRADVVTAIANHFLQPQWGCLQVKLKAQRRGVFKGLNEAPFAFGQVDTARRKS